MIPKYSAEDTTLPVVRPDGSMGSIAVPKGTPLTIHSAGLHYNREQRVQVMLSMIRRWFTLIYCSAVLVRPDDVQTL